MVKTTDKKLGRPSDYSQELADKICDELSEGKSLRTVCLVSDMPSKATVFMWMRTNKEFLDQYARAKEEATDALAEEIQDISDLSLEDVSAMDDPKMANAVVQAHRLRVDTRKWIMAKMKPKKYGDKLDMTTNGKDIPAPILGGATKE